MEYRESLNLRPLVVDSWDSSSAGSWRYFLALLPAMWHGCHMKPVIEISGLRKSYGAFQAVKGLSLTINQGEIFAILGPNGAGKTTTVEILEGFRAADSGEISVLGVDPAIKGKAALAWRNRIGIVLQSTQDTDDLSALEAVNHFASYYSNPRDPHEVLALVGLGDKSNNRARALSGGQRRRLDVALGIVGHPELLFLDEPTTGFDPEARRAFWQLIKQLRDEGTTILLTTHYLDEAEELADRVAVMNNGEIIEISTPALLGGRDSAKAIITWREDGVIKSAESDTPTQFLISLAERFGGEVPELTIRRPSLEDVYLSMIGENK
jgi:ABC-2 type transport system ATP-binding protein